MVEWRLVYTKQAQKDAKKLAQSGLKKNALRILTLIQKDPYTTPPKYEKLLGDLSGAFSRRINIQHRVVYQVNETEKTIKVIRLWTHYE